VNGPFTRLTGSLLTAATFVDASAPSGATYMVRAVKLENTPSGSYYNASQGIFWSAGGAPPPPPPPPPTGDTTAPTISLSTPANNATVSGSSVAVAANASDNVGVAGVQFKVDGANLGGEDASATYSVNWDTTTVANGSHSLIAVARDAAGNQTTATTISVFVSNSTPTSTSTMTITSADTTATEGTSDTASFTLTRTGSTPSDLTVTLTLTGMATKWEDYRRQLQGDM